MKVRKKPVVVDAIHLDGEMTANKLWDFCPSAVIERYDDENNRPFQVVTVGVPTLNGMVYARCGEWIIKGVKGEFYPCAHDVFLETYEIVPERAKEDESSHPRLPYDV